MKKKLQNIRIARVSTVPFFVFTQLRGQLEALAENGADVTIIASNDSLSDSMKHIKGCSFKPLSIVREISIFKDLVTLIKLWHYFRKERFDIVHSTTPKAGLLCSIAARLANTPICIHTYTGQTWVTMTGIKKLLVRYCDKLIGKLNNCCYTDSFSQRDFLINNKIIEDNKLKVIGHGSLAGIDINRFNTSHFSRGDREQLLDTLKIAPTAKILLFVGRVAKEKGIIELIDSLSQILKKRDDVYLLIVGPFDEMELEIRNYAQSLCKDKVIFIGFHKEPERFMVISDLLCLASYREGFGTVVIEAAALGLPTVGTNIYGLNDAVINGETGLLVEPRNSVQLTQALEKLLLNDELRTYMGQEAKARALKDFDSQNFNSLLIDEYNLLLSKSIS